MTPSLTVLLMFGRADMEVQSHRAQTDPSKDAGIRRLWTMASRFLSLTTRIHTIKLVCWPPVTPMAAIGCTPGLSQHAACGWMMRRCVWPLVCASELTSAKNMTAPVVSKLTEGAAMGCRVVEVLAGYLDMMPSTTLFTVPSWRRRSPHRKNRGAWPEMAATNGLTAAHWFHGSVEDQSPGMSLFLTP